ncbi:phosphatases II [Fomitopsis schrenkii]|uniref:Phosphatases II n=1 Tax=Fomitopsis schrenkii TaxID=2126942 RepID=S8E438_FOMSC|nr:phosphatases II [Fomitopsis schrenkii]
MAAVATYERRGASLPRPAPEYRVRSGTSSASTSAEADALRSRARPIPNSYWATPFLVACEFPYCPLTPAQLARRCTAQKLDTLLAAGVRTFVDLTEPHELFPYAPHLAAACAPLGIDPRDVEYHNFPIRDRALPASAAYVRKIIAVLRDNERRGRVAAVHCRGGIGRTGLVVGCWLVDSGRARDGTDALRMIAEEWKGVEKCKRYPYSPETGPQFEWVRTWVREKPVISVAAAAAVDTTLKSGAQLSIQ